MPIPKPKDKETQDEFVTRCMGNNTMNEEYPENDQRAAICYQTWRDRNKAATGGIERKAVSVTLKEDRPGTFTARIATLGVIDADNDVTLAGAFPTGKTVLVSAYQHGSWQGALPVGKAVIKEDGNQVIAEGEFNLQTESGKEHYEAIKFLGPLQEWSYGFKPLEFEFGEQDEKEVRFLKKVEPYEISPVLKGAGKDTMTLAIKGQDTTYLEHAETVLAAAKGLVERTEALAALRRKEGRILSQTNIERMGELHQDMSAIAGKLKMLLDANSVPDKAQGERLFLDYLRTQLKITEVINEIL